MSDLAKFRNAFYNYLTGLKIEMPEVIKTIDDMQFTIFWVKYIAVYKNNWDDGYEKLREIILDHGKEVPALGEDEKNKIKRYMTAISEILGC
jgi:hypothetical protein